MMSSKKTAVLSLLTFFLLGTAFGLLLDRSFLRKGPPRHGPRHEGKDFFFEYFTQELQLDSSQQDSLRAMLADLRKSFEMAGKEHFERMEQLRIQFGKDFEKILNPEQQVKFREMTEKFERQRAESDRRFRKMSGEGRKEKRSPERPAD